MATRCRYRRRAHAPTPTARNCWQTGARRILAANVAGATVQATLQAALQEFFGPQLPPLEWFASSAHRAGLRNGYANPAQLGCDRFAAAIGAHALLPQQALLVANCGTASTLDAVSADGLFAGGMIAPGLALMAQALARNTAQLPQVDAQHLPHQIADNTHDAIVAGCIVAQAGAIEKAQRQLAQRWGQPVQCVLSGGAAFAIAPALALPFVAIDNLVLHGLCAVLREVE